MLPAQRIVNFLIAAFLLSSCRVGPPKFADTVEEFVYVSLSFTPVEASQLGYHRHAGVSLDELLDDMSEAAMNRRRNFLRHFREGLSKIDPTKLTAEDRADYRTIQAAMDRQALELSERQSYKHDPTLYVDLILRGIDSAWNQTDQPETLRAFYVIRRLESVPALMQHARRNLVDRWSSITEAARPLEQRLGELDSQIPKEVHTKYQAARRDALTAVQEFEAAAVNLPSGTRPRKIPPEILSILQWDLPRPEKPVRSSFSAWKEDAQRQRDSAYAQIQPLARRILRTHFGDPEMIRGWVLYAGHTRIEQGDTSIKPSWIAAMKDAAANDPDAILGWRNWLCLQQAYGPPDFPQKVLGEGPLPPGALAELLTGKALPAACTITEPAFLK